MNIKKIVVILLVSFIPTLYSVKIKKECPNIFKKSHFLTKSELQLLHEVAQKCWDGENFYCQPCKSDFTISKFYYHLYKHLGIYKCSFCKLQAINEYSAEERRKTLCTKRKKSLYHNIQRNHLSAEKEAKIRKLFGCKNNRDEEQSIRKALKNHTFWLFLIFGEPMVDECAKQQGSLIKNLFSEDSIPQNLSTLIKS